MTKLTNPPNLPVTERKRLALALAGCNHTQLQPAALGDGS
jgi:hypothetical protein